MDDADVGIVVPSEHGADGFIEFGAAVFMDAAGVGPSKGAVKRTGFGAEEKEFVEACASGDVGDVGGECLSERGLTVGCSNWVRWVWKVVMGGRRMQQASGQGTHLVVLSQRVSKLADHRHIVERRFAICEPSM